MALLLHPPSTTAAALLRRASRTPIGHATKHARFATSRRRKPSTPTHPANPAPPAHFTYLALHKPFQVLCQFSPSDGKRTLADVLPPTTPKDVYPVGRLDYDSEGLVLLTNDTQVNGLLLHSTRHHEREYLVQVEGDIQDQGLDALRQGGLVLNLGKGKSHTTRPCPVAERMFVAAGEDAPAGVAPRDPPIRVRKSIPTSWLRLSMTEGKNRQVRRMVAAVGFPCLRLLRARIEDLGLGELQPGQAKELTREETYRKLKLLPPQRT